MTIIPKPEGARTAKVDIDFADGEYPFALRIGELIELDEKFATGPMVMIAGLINSDWRLPWVKEIIRLGLIGGGMEPSKAQGMTRRYVEDRPEWTRNANIALIVLSAAINGFDQESPGKSSGAAKRKRRARRAPMAASPSPPITTPPPSSD